MPIINYPFLPLGPGHPPRPLLPIRIVNPETNRGVRAWGLIDTGADECSIPARLAAKLGHNLRAGTAKTIGTAGGDATAFAHTTRIELFSIRDHETVVYTISDTPVDFCPGLDVILLGVKNFLSNFMLIIDYPKQCFSIKRQ